MDVPSTDTVETPWPLNCATHATKSNERLDMTMLRQGACRAIGEKMKLQLRFAGGLLGAVLLSQTAVLAADLAGHYDITVMCASGNGWGRLDVLGSGNTYSINGSSSGGTYTGRIRGSQVSMKFVGSGNEADFTGTVTTPGQMSGSLTQKSSFGGACRWMATRKGEPIKSKPVQDPDLEEAKGYIERAKIVQRQPGCSSQRLAAELLASASGIYRLKGMATQSDKINSYADKLTGEGGTYYQCLAKQNSKRSIPKSTKSKADRAGKEDPRKPSSNLKNCLRAQLLLKQLEDQDPKPKGVDGDIANLKRELARHNCKIKTNRFQ